MILKKLRLKVDKQIGLCFDGDLRNRDLTTSLRWIEEDIKDFGVSKKQVGKLVFEADIRPLFMFDARFVL